MRVWPNNCALLDDFTRANGSLGSNWYEVDTGAYTISGNALLMTDSSTGIAVWRGTSFGADQQACMRFTSTVGGANSYAGLILKSSHNNASPSSVIHVDVVSNGSVEVTTYDSSVGFQTWDNAATTLTTGDVLGAIAHASGVVEVYVNNTQVLSVDLSSWGHATGGGYIGVSADSLASNVTVDDFGGGDYALGGPNVAAGELASAPTSVLDQVSLWIDTLMTFAQNLLGYATPDVAPSGSGQSVERRLM